VTAGFALQGLVPLVALWLMYFGLHSWLASLTAKRWVAAHRPTLMPYYRLGFNVLAVVLILPILWLTFAAPGPTLWRWEGPWGWLANALAAGAIAGVLYSTRYYDGREFLGLRQLRDREHRVEDQERLYISPLHRYVRHPWYSLGLVVIWTRDMDAAFLVSAVAITAYLIVGSRLEERKLLAYHGEAYRSYRSRVPALIPRPWRFLSAEEARKIQGAAPP
jgi:protein-S-isoprenylcysteine O-methyltransferase Ste14